MIPIILMTILLAGIWGSVAGASVLEFEEKDVQLEASLLDEGVEAVFRFVNSGEAPVRIERIRSSCGCTVPKLEKRLYQPGEAGEIRARFTFGGRSGEQRKVVRVYTDEKGVPPIRLSLGTHIPKWAEREPPLLLWRAGEERKPKMARIHLHPSGNVRVGVFEGYSTEPFAVERVVKEGTVVTYAITPPSVEEKERATRPILLELVLHDEAGKAVGSKRIRINCLAR